MPLTCDVESSLEEDWTEAMMHVVHGCHTGVGAAVNEGVAEARSLHAYKDRTAGLTRSTQASLVQDTPDGLGAEAEMGAFAAYASFVENGTKPHVISARPGGFLRWEDSDGVHYAKSVNHPGTRPAPFMGPAYLKAERVLERELELAVAGAQKFLDK